MALFEKEIPSDGMNLKNAVRYALFTCRSGKVEDYVYLQMTDFLELKFAYAKVKNPANEALLNELLKECTGG